MKKMKKFLSLSVAAVLALSMTACGSKAGDTQNADATEKQHEALDAATKGFKDYLTEKLGDTLFLTSRTPRVILPHVQLSSTPSFPKTKT